MPLISVDLFGFRFFVHFRGSRDRKVAPTAKRPRSDPNALFAQPHSRGLAFHRFTAHR